MDSSRKVIFSILAVVLIGMIPLAYAVTGDFILNFDASGADGLAVDSNDRIIVGFGSSVDIVDSTGAFVVTLSGGAGFVNANSIAVNSTNYIIVGDRSTDIVEIYNPSGTFVRTLSGGSLTVVVGVAVNSTGHIFVAEDGAVDLIKIYDRGGFFLKSFTGSDFGGTNFLDVVDITIDSNDRLLVLESALVDTVQIFDGNESFVSDFAGDEFGSGIAWDDPTAIATDASNRILVVHTPLNPDAVQIYDSTGLFLSTFTGAQGGGEAWEDGQINRIAVDSNSRIIVTDEANSVVQIHEGVDFVSTTSSGSSSGGDHQWQTRPTFGLNHNTFSPLVDGGFSFNGKSHDITDNWWTPFAEQKVKIGTTNTFTAKTYADKQLWIQEFLFGIPSIGDAHKAELGIEIVYDYSGEIEMINVVQKTDVIDIDSIKVVHSKSKCQSVDTVEKCDTTRLSMKFLEPLQDKIMAIKAIDFKDRVHITYLNEGFDISGDSLNPMNTKMIPSTEKFEGLIEVTQTAKYSDIWTTQDDREFEMNEYGSFKQINQIFGNDSNLMDERFSSDFADYKKSLADKYAQLLLESCPNCFTSFADFDDSWAYEIPEEIDRLEIISHLIEIEKQKATQVLEDAQLDITYPDAEIDLDNRPISVILAEERVMKKILADERFYLKQILAPQQ